jgi:hypothetical protein
MSATLKRERRATAGKRMTSLIGKAQEKDDAFWGHETWGDEDDSGNDSFRESDEDSAERKDEFDSDFNDSESDHEDEEQAAGDEEERQMGRDERKKRALQRPQEADIQKAGRALMPKRKGGKGTGSKRVVGVGDNAGIVLNIPGGLPKANPYPTQTLSLTAAPPKPQKVESSDRLIVVSTRPRRATSTALPTKYTSRTRAARSDARTITSGVGLDDTKRKSTATAGSGSATGTGTAAATGKTKKRRKRFSQEELLLESVNETEPSNDRWLLARKRNRDQSEKKNEAPGREARGKVIEQFSSRRGYLNTVTFPEMDHVPEILTRQEKRAPPKPCPIMCVITGQRARYRDPRTGQGYYDAAAFRELRQRHAAGEPLDQRKSTSNGATEVTTVKEQTTTTKIATTAKTKTKAPKGIRTMNGSATAAQHTATATATGQVDAAETNESTKHQAPVAAGKTEVVAVGKTEVVAAGKTEVVAAAKTEVATAAKTEVATAAKTEVEAEMEPPKINRSTKVEALPLAMPPCAPSDSASAPAMPPSVPSDSASPSSFPAPRIMPCVPSAPVSSPAPRIVTSNSSPTKGAAEDSPKASPPPNPTSPAVRKESGGNSSAASSTNSRRASPRRRKPSAKVLESMGIKGVVVTVPGHENGNGSTDAAAAAAKAAVSPTTNGNRGKTTNSTKTSDSNPATLDTGTGTTDKATATDLAVENTNASQKSTDKLPVPVAAPKEEPVIVLDAKLPDAQKKT